MDSYRDETEITSHRQAVVVLGVVAFTIGHGHGMNLHAGGTPAGHAILDEENHDIWFPIYDIALRSVVINGSIDKVADAITRELPDLLTDKARRDQIKENFHLRIPDKVVMSLAIEFAALGLGVWASLTGRRLGIAKSTWVPPASEWVDIFEAARDGAMLGARIEVNRFQDGEVGFDEFIKSMKTVAGQKATEAAAPVSITASAMARTERESKIGDPPLPPEAWVFPDISQREGAFEADTSSWRLPPSRSVLALGVLTLLVGALLAFVALLGVIPGGFWYFAYGAAMVWGILMMAGSSGRR